MEYGNFLLNPRLKNQYKGFESGMLSLLAVYGRVPKSKLINDLIFINDSKILVLYYFNEPPAIFDTASFAFEKIAKEEISQTFLFKSHFVEFEDFRDNVKVYHNQMIVKEFPMTFSSHTYSHNYEVAGNKIIITNGTDSLHIYDVQTKSFVEIFPKNDLTTIKSNDYEFETVSFCVQLASNKILVTRGLDFAYYDINSGKLLEKFAQNYTYEFKAITISPDGKFVICNCVPKNYSTAGSTIIALFDANTLNLVKELLPLEENKRDTVFRRNPVFVNDLLFISSTNKTITAFNTQLWKCVYKTEVNEDIIKLRKDALNENVIFGLTENTVLHFRVNSDMSSKVILPEQNIKSEVQPSPSKTNRNKSDQPGEGVPSLYYLDNLKTSSGEVVFLGDLELPTGSIVACDPVAAIDFQCFSKSVPAGKYPVYMYIDNKSGKIAAAEIKFNEQEVAKWEMALKPGQNISNLKKGEVFGYPVDAGTGCFMDKKTAALYEKLLEDNDFYYDDVIEDEMDENGGLWTNHYPNKKASLNVIMFSSGYGDGSYASYWGLSKDEQLICLATDFCVLKLKK